MLEALTKWSLNHRLVVLVAALAFLGWGLWQAQQMPVDVFPDLAAPTVNVVAETHGMAPQEVESQITIPLESALNSATGVRRVRSDTGIGNTLIVVEFDWDTDLRQARQTVAEQLQVVASELPAEVPAPVMGPISSVMGEVLFVALRSEEHSPLQLRSEADWLIQQRITSVPGVSQVVVMGGGIKQYQVVLSPERMVAYGLAVDEVLEALKQTNENISAGFYDDAGREYLIYGLGRVERPSDLEEALVQMRDGIPIRIGDIGHVEVGAALSRGAGSLNGQEAVILAVHKQPDANTLELTRQLDEVFEEIDRALPAPMEVERNLFRQADFIEVAVANVVRALRDGSLLVVVIILIFLANPRATFVTASVIPLSLLVALVVLQTMGGTINTMTLGGMAIAVGVLVDDAIVVVENVVRRLHLNQSLAVQERRPATTVIFEATREVISPLLYGNLVVFLVFLPLLFLSGVEGRLLEPLGIAFIVSVLASLLVALTVTPVLCHYLLTSSTDSQVGGDGHIVRWLKRSYEPALKLTLPHWKVIGALSLIGVAVAGWGLTKAGQSFLPEFNEGSLTISANALPGTSLETSDELGRWVEEVLHRHPEVRSTSRRTGRAERDEHAMGVNSSEIDVMLTEDGRSHDELVAALREGLAEVPGVDISIEQPLGHRIDHMLTGTRSSVAINIFGDDLYELRRLAALVEGAIADVDGVVDLNVEQQTDVPFLMIDLDREALADYGLRVAEVNAAIETAYLGHVTDRILEKQRSYDLLVRYDDEVRGSVEAIRQTLITTPDGVHVPLHAVAQIRRDRRPNSISRENARRKITVSCNVSGADLVGVVDAIQERVDDEVDFPSGYHVQYGGQFQRATEASRTLSALTLLAILGIFLLFYVALNSLRDALLVMVNLPLALIGGVVGIFVLDGVMSLASLIGFITLFGIATRNGLLLISHIRHLHEQEGVAERFEAVRRGAMERLSPILMTALASGLGLLPLAMQAGQPGGEIQAPMAMVILFGLISSTVLNMFVVPALYLRFGDIGGEAIVDVG